MKDFSSEPSSNSQSSYAPLMRFMNHENGLLRTFQDAGANSIQEHASYLRDLLEVLQSIPHVNLQDTLRQYKLDCEGNNLVQIWIKSIQHLPMSYHDDCENTPPKVIKLTVTESYHAQFICYLEQCLRRFIEICPDFLKHRNHQGKNVLYTACQYGDIFLARALTSEKPADNFIDWLIGKGVSVHMRDIDGNTLLHDAAAFGCAETVQLLMDKGLRATQPNRYDATPLSFALLGRLKNHRYSDHTTTIQLLMKAMKEKFDSCFKRYPHGYDPDQIVAWRTLQKAPDYFTKDGKIYKVSHYSVTQEYLVTRDEKESWFRITSQDAVDPIGNVWNGGPRKHSSLTNEPVIFNEPMQSAGLWLESSLQSVFYRYRLYIANNCTPAQAFFALFENYTGYQYLILLKALPELITQHAAIYEAVVKQCARNELGHTVLTALLHNMNFIDSVNDQFNTPNPNRQGIEILNCVLREIEICIKCLLDYNPYLIRERVESINNFNTLLHEAAYFMKNLKYYNYPLEEIESQWLTFLIERVPEETFTQKDRLDKTAFYYCPRDWRNDPVISRWKNKSELTLKDNVTSSVATRMRNFLMR